MRAGTFTLPAVAGRPVSWLARRLAMLRNPVTLGVRAIVLDPAGRVFLVRHTYVPGWHLPGGGVEAGETVVQAALRETREETGLVVTAAPVLLGLYLNRALDGRDHVAVFVVREAAAAERPGTDWEIAERGFFARDALPEGVTGPTLARLAEALDGVPARETW